MVFDLSSPLFGLLSRQSWLHRLICFDSGQFDVGAVKIGKQYIAVELILKKLAVHIADFLRCLALFGAKEF